MADRRPGKLPAILAIAVATAAFTAGDVCLKITASSLPASEVIVARNTFALILLFAAATLSGDVAALRRSFETPILLRGGAESVATLLFVAALVAVPIGTVTAIAQTVPLVITLLGAAMLSERVGPHRWAAVVVGFAGAVLVASPSGGGVSVYTLLAFGVPLIVAFRDLVARRVGTAIPVLPMLFGLVALTGAGALLVAPFGAAWHWPEPRLWALLAVAACFIVIAHGGIVVALRRTDLADIAPFYFLQTIWGVVAGTLVFDEHPGAIALVGIALVLGSGLYVLHRERVGRKAPTPPPLVG